MVGSLFRNSALAMIYRCSGAVVTFAFGIIFARMMSIEEYGALVSLMTFGLVAATIGGVGQQLRVLLEVPSLAAQKNYTAISATLTQRLRVTCAGSIIITLMAFAMFVIAHGRDGTFGRWEYSTSLLLILPLALVELQSCIARALGSVNLALAPKEVLWRPMIIFICGAVFLAYGGPLNATDVFLVAAAALVLLIIGQQIWLRRLVGGHKLFLAFAKRQSGIRDIVSTSVPFWVTSVAAVLFAAIDIVIVSVMVGPESAGYYYAANRLSLLLDFFLSTFCVPAAPLIARLFDEGSRTEIVRVTSGAALAAFVAVLICFIAMALAGNIALMAFGPSFVRAHGVMMVLAAGQLVATYFGVGSIALNMTGHHRAAMRIMVLTSVLGVAGLVVATWAFGIWGTAFVVATVNVATRAWMAAYIYAAEGIDLTATTRLRSLAESSTWLGTTLIQEMFSVSTGRATMAKARTPAYELHTWRGGDTAKPSHDGSKTRQQEMDLHVGGDSDQEPR